MDNDAGVRFGQAAFGLVGVAAPHRGAKAVYGLFGAVSQRFELHGEAPECEPVLALGDTRRAR